MFRVSPSQIYCGAANGVRVYNESNIITITISI